MKIGVENIEALACYGEHMVITFHNAAKLSQLIQTKFFTLKVVLIQTWNLSDMFTEFP